MEAGCNGNGGSDGGSRGGGYVEETGGFMTYETERC